ncbi:MAG: hypothetical protein AAFR02_06810 [Pseudomonadota bacterium]
MKNLLPQTLGKTLFDFVTFLAVAERPDIRAQRSIGEYGLVADFRRIAPVGPYRSLNHGLDCCSRSRLSGHSLRQ